MKFLSKFAELLGKGAQILQLFQPSIQIIDPKAGQVTQVVSKDLNEILLATADAEAVGVALSLKGSDKLKAAIPKVSDIILKSAALAGHKVANVDLYNQGVAKIADGSADIANSLDIAGIQVTNKQA